MQEIITLIGIICAFIFGLITGYKSRECIIALISFWVGFIAVQIICAIVK